MIKIQNIEVDFTNIDITPYFQVKAENRIRFGLEVFEDHGTRLLQDILNDVFLESSSVSASFITGYIYKNKRSSLKTGLGEIVKISNWKESLIEDPINERTIIFGTINNLQPKHIFAYTKMIIQGHRQSYIIFYNDDVLIYVSSDVVDIITDKNLITNLKSKYNKYYAQGFE
ncbi:hypothetical protein MKY20_24335 [Cytobacillus sp. FSL W8-0315]|uniref:hypothetical protein n=1 Tax=Cytobacillus sp. FSL W8-0315 TaxID=2921600 RepID=UPI0001F4559F|nr:hypothetical protein HMPREF1013_05078 [Bacillus sp. 2_A_57_CT2]